MTPEETCAHYGAEPDPINPDELIALSSGVNPSALPLHGLRLRPSGEMSGWWIWAGDGDAMPDDFQPEHAYHLVERCPATLPFMALPPGWRFVISDSGDAAEFDASLLE